MTNDLFGYLPKALQNDFIKEGHNRYAPVREARKEATKNVKQERKDFRAAKRGRSTETVVEAGGQVYGARKERREAVAAARGERKEHRQGKRVARLERKLEKARSK